MTLELWQLICPNWESFSISNPCIIGGEEWLNGDSNENLRGELEIYNLEKDISETNSIVKQNSELAARAEELFKVRTESIEWPLKSMLIDK